MNQSEMDAYLIEEAKTAAEELNDIVDLLREQGLDVTLLLHRDGKVHVEARRKPVP